jgi:DMSO/TMAO reductase YedYZ molybdopterin-dependent catalytic subunit
MKTWRVIVWGIVLGLSMVLSGCLVESEPAMSPATGMPTSTPQQEQGMAATPTACALPTVVAPTPPATIPGYAELDPTTGLHVTGGAPEVNLEAYRLEVTGKVDRPLTLTYDELRCMPKLEVHCTLICPGFFQDEATWAGASLDYVLDQAGVHPDAEGLKLVSVDGYVTEVSMEAAREGDNFLAYEWEGEPLPVLHGFPVRAVFPALQGNKWAKWLVEIEVF